MWYYKKYLKKSPHRYTTKHYIWYMNSYLRIINLYAANVENMVSF